MIKQKKSRTLFKHNDQIKNMLLNKKALRVTKTIIKDSDLLQRIRKKIIKNRQAQQLRNNDKVKK
jgi:hypothetical protein